MSRNGAGVFAVINPILVGALRSSSAVNANFSDMGAAITDTVALDGQTVLTGPAKGFDGSRSAPGFMFDQDRNTGWRRSAVDEMRWVGGGADRFYIDANGKAWQLGAADVAGTFTVDGTVTGANSDPLLIAAFASNGFARRQVVASVGTWTPTTWGQVVSLMFGGSNTILPAAQVMGEILIPYACTITGGVLGGDQTGSVSVDIRKCAYADYSATRPQASDSICGGNPLAFTSAVGVVDGTLSGWTTSVAAGDVLRFYINSVTSITRLTVALALART